MYNHSWLYTEKVHFIDWPFSIAWIVARTPILGETSKQKSFKNTSWGRTYSRIFLWNILWNVMMERIQTCLPLYRYHSYTMCIHGTRYMFFWCFAAIYFLVVVIYSSLGLVERVHVTPTALKEKLTWLWIIVKPPIYQKMKTPGTFGAGSGYFGICVFVNDIKRGTSIREQRNPRAENNPPRKKNR